MDTKWLNKLISEYINEANKYWPNFSFGHSSSGFIGTEGPKSGEFEFYNQQQSFSQTSYYPDCTEFIHYTSFENVQNILNSGELRLYNLLNFNDPSELSFGLKEFSQLDITQIDDHKRHFFVHSLCKYPTEDFDMWRKYGFEGKGAAIVYEILNPLDSWYKFYLGKVHYGDTNKPFIDFKAFINFHNAFNTAHNNPIRNIPEFLFAISLFHKKQLWHPENEYRLITKVEYEKHVLEADDLNSQPFVYDTLRHQYKDSGKMVSYVSFPLWKREDKFFPKINNEREQILKGLPHIKIKKVILGFQINDGLAANLFLFTRHRSVETFGYFFPSVNSELRTEFYR